VFSIVPIYRLYHTHSLGSVEPTIALSESLWSRIVTKIKRKKSKKSENKKFQKKIASICLLMLCVCLCSVSCSFQFRWWFEFICCDLENVGYMLRLCVICFVFNMHNLWLLEILCPHRLCWLIDCNPRSTFEHTLTCIPRNCEDLSLLNIHMYASFIHLLVFHVCTIHEFWT
jgi:hypothetical protein